MSDLSAKLSHLEALREGAEKGDEEAVELFEDDLIDASPWLIPLAQQAEKLAAASNDVAYCTSSVPAERDRRMAALRDRLAEFEAIKKEAENAP